MKLFTSLLISIFFFNFTIVSQKMEKYEDSLITLLENVHFSKDLNKAMEYNKVFKKTLKQCINDPLAFDYPFDSLSYFMCTKTSPDGSFRLFNWNIELKNQEQHYECIILKKINNVEDLILIDLYDQNKNKPEIEFLALNERTWYGALYFDIIPVKKNNKTIYTLLGWDGNNLFSNKKIIETMVFQKKTKIQFGVPLFSYPDGKTKRRVIFQYNKKSYMSLKHNKIKKEDFIIFDHLSPTSPHLKDFPDWYVTDLSFDAFKWENNKWIFVQDFDAKSMKLNRKPFNDPNK